MNPFGLDGFCENAHYHQSNPKIIDSDLWSTYVYDSETGTLSQWILGECHRTKQVAPAGAVFFGESDGDPYGAYFVLQDEVYISDYEEYRLLLGDVKGILTLKYHYDDYHSDAPVFILENGQIMTLIHDYDHEYRLYPIQ